MTARITFRFSTADETAFENAVFHAERARFWRSLKRKAIERPLERPYALSVGECEISARHHERRVREIALQSEIALQRACDRGAP